MATTPSAPDGPSKPYEPYVPATTTMSEFTIRALVLGLLMSVILGAANAYLGLKAGMTIAATYPAAVISMAVLRLLRGNILEENFARTVGSIGESVAAGAIFTIPAFVILKIWTFQPEHLGQVPHRHGADDHRRPARHHVRHHPAAGDGGGHEPAVPGVGGGLRDSQGRPEGVGSGHAALQGDGRRRAAAVAGRPRRVRQVQRVRRGAGQGEGELRPARSRCDLQDGADRRRHHDLTRPPPARPTSAWATSSGRCWAR